MVVGILKAQDSILNAFYFWESVVFSWRLKSL